jgi:hypothetical protein
VTYVYIHADEAIDRFRLWKSDNADAPAAVAVEELRIMQTFAGLRVVDRLVIFAGATFSENLVTANEVWGWGCMYVYVYVYM